MRSVERFEDMSPTGKLRLIEQDDGDMIVAIVPDVEESNRNGRLPVSLSVEFCTFGGGGQSPRTLDALRDLMTAMVLDNGVSQLRDAAKKGG